MKGFDNQIEGDHKRAQRRVHPTRVITNVRFSPRIFSNERSVLEISTSEIAVLHGTAALPQLGFANIDSQGVRPGGISVSSLETARNRGLTPYFAARLVDLEHLPPWLWQHQQATLKKIRTRATTRNSANLYVEYLVYLLYVFTFIYSEPLEGQLNRV